MIFTVRYLGHRSAAEQRRSVKLFQSSLQNRFGDELGERQNKTIGWWTGFKSHRAQNSRSREGLSSGNLNGSLNQFFGNSYFCQSLEGRWMNPEGSRMPGRFFSSLKNRA